MATLPSTKLLITHDDLPRLGINYSNSTLLRWEKAGTFPKRVRLGAHSVAWFASEVLDHLKALQESRGDER